MVAEYNIPVQTYSEYDSYWIVSYVYYMSLKIQINMSAYFKINDKWWKLQYNTVTIFLIQVHQVVHLRGACESRCIAHLGFLGFFA